MKFFASMLLLSGLALAPMSFGETGKNKGLKATVQPLAKDSTRKLNAPGEKGIGQDVKPSAVKHGKPI